VNGIKFYSHFNYGKSKDEHIIKFGDSFKICIDTDISADGEAKVKLNFKPSSMLRDYVKDTRFFLAFLENKSFEIDGNEWPFPADDIQFQEVIVQKESEFERLLFAEKAVRALDVLGIQGDIDRAKLSDQEVRNLFCLVKALVDKEPISGLKDDLPCVAYMPIGEYQIALAIKKVPDKLGTYTIEDLFTSKIRAARQDNEGTMHPIPIYGVLRAEQLLQTSNLQPDLLLKSYQDFRSPLAFKEANEVMLRLLLAYDESKDYRIDLLEVAFELATWLCGKETDVYKRMNVLQVAKRKRGLVDKEKEELYEIIEKNPEQPDALVAAYLLLEQQIPARRFFDKMGCEKQEEFKHLPIWRFWNEQA
jgi:hypothetical protein